MSEPLDLDAIRRTAEHLGYPTILALCDAVEEARARLAAVLAATEARRAARDLSFTAYTDLRRAAEGTP